MSQNYLKKLQGVSPILTTVAQGYTPNRFIAETVFPVVSVEAEIVKFPTHGKVAFEEYETRRAIGADSNVIVLDGNGWETVTLEEHDLAAGVDYRAEKEAYFSQKAKAARRVKDGVLLKNEVIVAGLVQNASSYASGHVRTLSGTSQWSDQANSNPLADVDAAKDKIAEAVGLRPNIMVIGAGVLKHLRYHPKLQAQLGANDKKRITLDILKDLFELEDIIIGESRLTANGQFANVWGNHVSLQIRGANSAGQPADEGNPSFGYTFRRSGLPFIDTYEGVGGKVEYVRYTDIKKAVVTGGKCGYLLKDVVA